jgi:hypothetical protein
MRRDIEHQHQKTLFQEWVPTQIRKYPELGLMFAIPNGGVRPYKTDASGVRYSREAQKLRDEGLKKGVPDIFLPVARGFYNGMFIEMKAPKGRETKEQKEWAVKLAEQDYRVVTCYGWDKAAEQILNYLTLDARISDVPF